MWELIKSSQDLTLANELIFLATFMCNLQSAALNLCLIFHKFGAFRAPLTLAALGTPVFIQIFPPVAAWFQHEIQASLFVWFILDVVVQK